MNSQVFVNSDNTPLLETLTLFGTALPRMGQAIKVGQAMCTHFQISPKGKQCHKYTGCFLTADITSSINKSTF